MGECAEKAGGETLSCELKETSEPTGQINKKGAPNKCDSKRDSPPVVAIHHTGESGTTYVVKPKLPKLMLTRFNGDNTKFRSFWDSFESAVDNNPDLLVIDKFNYLNSLLEGAAARSIQGLPLSVKSYEAAKEILNEHFEKTQTIISAHMEKLLQVQKCSGEKTSQFRLVHDKIHANIRGLEVLGVKAKAYGCFLFPVIMAKLPSEVRLQIARATTRDVWKAGELLQVIKCEVEACELSDTVRVSEGRTELLPGTGRQYRGITSSFLVREQGPRGRSCLYCKGEHLLASCEVVKDVPARREVLKKDGRCFVCLAMGHHARQCHSAKRCHKCGH